MAQSNHPPRARSYLVRIWEEPDAPPPGHAFRLTVETPQGERRGFDSPEALARYLNDVTATMALEADAAAGDERGVGR
jgi:hypothetical protein